MGWGGVGGGVGQASRGKPTGEAGRQAGRHHLVMCGWDGQRHSQQDEQPCRPQTQPHPCTQAANIAARAPGRSPAVAATPRRTLAQPPALAPPALPLQAGLAAGRRRTAGRRDTGPPPPAAAACPQAPPPPPAAAAPRLASRPAAPPRWCCQSTARPRLRSRGWWLQLWARASLGEPTVTANLRAEAQQAGELAGRRSAHRLAMLQSQPHQSRFLHIHSPPLHAAPCRPDDDTARAVTWKVTSKGGRGDSHPCPAPSVRSSTASPPPQHRAPPSLPPRSKCVSCVQGRGGGRRGDEAPESTGGFEGRGRQVRPHQRPSPPDGPSSTPINCQSPIAPAPAAHRHIHQDRRLLAQARRQRQPAVGVQEGVGWLQVQHRALATRHFWAAGRREGSKGKVSWMGRRASLPACLPACCPVCMRGDVAKPLSGLPGRRPPCCRAPCMPSFLLRPASLLLRTLHAQLHAPQHACLAPPHHKGLWSACSARVP